MIPVPKKAKEDNIRLRLVELSMDLEEAFRELAADYRAAGKQRYTDLYEVPGMVFDRYIKGACSGNVWSVTLWTDGCPAAPSGCYLMILSSAESAGCGIT